MAFSHIKLHSLQVIISREILPVLRTRTRPPLSRTYQEMGVGWWRAIGDHHVNYESRKERKSQAWVGFEWDRTEHNRWETAAHSFRRGYGVERRTTEHKVEAGAKVTSYPFKEDVTARIGVLKDQWKYHRSEQEHGEIVANRISDVVTESTVRHGPEMEMIYPSSSS